MKKNQWILGVVLLAFVALLVTASLLYGGLSQDNAPDNLIIEDHAATTAATTTTATSTATKTTASTRSVVYSILAYPIEIWNDPKLSI